jgi:hypothetical protein
MLLSKLDPELKSELLEPELERSYYLKKKNQVRY